MAQKSLPEVDPVAAASGIALSVLVAMAGLFLGFPAFAGLAGVAAGGYFAARIARRDGMFHGAVVAVIAIILASIAASAGNAGVSNILADTLTIIVSDLLLLGFGSAGGWLATRS